MFRKLSWSLCFLGALWFSNPLHAQSKADSDKAAEWYQLAMEAMESGEWGQAALGFDAAHRLDPDPRLLYNAARAYEKGGNLENARKRYKEFLIFKDAPEELRQKAVDQLVAIELKLRAAEEAAKQPASRPMSAPDGGPRAIAPPDTSAALAPRPEGTAPLRVITAFNERYHVTIRDADGNSYKCPSVSRKRHCAHYVAQGRAKVSVGGAVSGSQRIFVGDEGSTVNLRDAATGPLIGTIASWASFALGSGMIALAFDDGADINDAMLLATFGSLLATYGLIGGVAFTIVWAAHDEMTTKIGADDLTEDEVGVSWHGIGVAPGETGVVAATGISF